MWKNTQQNPVIVFLKNIWPFVYRVINTLIYWFFSLIKGLFKGIMDQIKGSF